MKIRIIEPKTVTMINGTKAYFNDGDLNLFRRINRRYFIDINKRFLDTLDLNSGGKFLIKEIIY